MNMLTTILYADIIKRYVNYDYFKNKKFYIVLSLFMFTGLFL